MSEGERERKETINERVGTGNRFVQGWCERVLFPQTRDVFTGKTGPRREGERR
jgi:hypothetical protein